MSVYQSPNYDNGYDISDYQDIMADLEQWLILKNCETSTSKGLKIIMISCKSYFI
ncbi:MAG: hypothetical protein ACLRQF_20810 [Thomasclavelia ramosa]